MDSPAYRAGLKLYKKLYDAGTSPKDFLLYEFAEANAAFGSGQVATMLQWNAAFGDLDNKEKKLACRRQDRHRRAAGSGSAGRFTHIHGLGLGLNWYPRNTRRAH